MIQANELRLGNWYKWLHEEEETYHQADPDFIKKQNEYNLNPDDEQFSRGWWANPIPITEKWLIQFGFKQNEPISSREFILSIDGVNIIKIINHYKDGWLFQCYWWNAGHMIKYVHQLQNIVYIITGQELTSNTKS